MEGGSRFELTNFGDGQIVNHGEISVQEAGLVAFVGKNVANSGVINARVGKVALAAGDTTATVDLYGDGLVEFAVDGAKGKVLSANSGTINAQGGTVAITANAAKDVVDNVINMDGIVNVSSVTVQGGKIILGGGKSGKVSVTGKLDASGKTGGGKIEVKGRDIEIGANSVIAADATDTGNGGTIEAIADNVMTFEGSVLARGGAQSGNGGWIEVSGYEGLDYRGNADTTAANGSIGTLFLDPRFTIIHSGVFLPGIFQQYVISHDVLALQLRTNNVLLQADEFIDVGTRTGSYNLNIADPFTNATLNSFLNLLPDNNIDLSTWNFLWASGTTAGSLTLKSAEVNFNRNLKMGDGNLTVNAPTVNLNARIQDKAGADLSDSRLIGSALVSTINVKSNAAKIQQAISLSDDDTALTTINVGDGTYTENVVLDKSKVKLQSVNGRDTTTIDGIGGVNALGAVLITAGVNNSQVGDIDKGFTINGFDNGNPGIENAALYVQGAHTGLKVIGNKIVAKGDEALATEYGFANTDMVIDSNKFSGKTYVGATPATGNQFEVPNVSRQLVALNRGHANLQFTNNDIVGDAGFNQLVSIESVGSTISGNKFDGKTTSASLRVRGSNIDVFNNKIDGNGGGYGIWAQNVAGLLIGENDANKIDNTGKNAIQIEGGSGTIKVNNNKIGTLGGAENINGDGIFATGANTIELKKNTIKNTKSSLDNVGSGIHLQSLYGAVVGGSTAADANIIRDTAWDGIRFYQVTTSKVENNDIKDVKRTGVFVGWSSLNQILTNKIVGADRYGVNVDNSVSTTISGNNIDDAGLHGINVLKLTGTNVIKSNFVDTTGNDGIHAKDVTGLTIEDNKIGLDGSIKGDGIFGDNVSQSVIRRNTINDTVSTEDIKGSGIQVWNSWGVTIGGSEGNGNTITNADWDGIRLYQVADKSYVSYNDIDTVGRTGLFAGWSSDIRILNNEITDATRYGIHYDNSSTATIAHNDIDDTDIHGIHLYKVAGINLVDDNDITGAKGDGIHAENVSNLTVSGNDIRRSGQNGILVKDGYNVAIGAYTKQGYSNTITKSGLNGIEVSGTTGEISIVNNRVKKSGVNGATGSDGDGIKVHDIAGDENSFIYIDSNKVTKSAEDGIEVSNVTGKVSIRENIIKKAGYNYGSDNSDESGHDGIFVSNVSSVYQAPSQAGRSAVAANGSYDVSIVNNDISKTEDDGIEVINSGRTLIEGNDIVDVGLNATYAENDGYGADGIHVRNVYNYNSEQIVTLLEALESEVIGLDSAVDILNNYINVDRNSEGGEFIGSTADDGIQVWSSGDSVIDSNHVANSGVSNETPSEDQDPNVEIIVLLKKAISYLNQDSSGADGINVTKSQDYDFKVVSTEGNRTDITNNFVDNSTDDGIETNGVNHVFVDNNDVDVSGGQGIVLRGYALGNVPDDSESSENTARVLGLFAPDNWTAIVTNNIVNNSDKNGIKIKNFDEIEVSAQNIVSNSKKSGLLVTGAYNGNVNVAGNTFTDNKIGATFRSGLIDLTGESNTFNNGEVGLRFSPIQSEGEGGTTYSYLELVDDDAPGVQSPSDRAPITNFGGTIGAQIFNNQSEYFVELRNGAFYNPGTPTWLNGTNSTYTFAGTTLTPSSNSLNDADYAFLEPKFRDWNDFADLGRFWALFVPGEVDQQNIFDTFASFAAVGGQVNVVLLGLPSLTGGAGPAPTAFDPNAIEPAAGGDEGMTPDELNNIQTAAGGETNSNSSCWSDASAAATGGSTTTFSFSSVINQTTLAQATSCGSTQGQ